MNKELSEILEKNHLSSNIISAHSVGGGCVSSAYEVKTSDSSYFIKINSPDFANNFKSEFMGLQKIHETNAILCPTPFATGIHKNHSYLVMSILPSLGGGTSALGAPLAKMHLAGQSKQFGFPEPTYCGATLLDNTMTDQPWSEWFAEHRIGKILQDIGPKKITKYPVKDICQAIAAELRSHDPDVTPSLVHGDLWNGNCGTSEGKPCIFDPAVYYADPEVDLAMTELFGGFGQRFFYSYQTVRPIPDGYERRKEIYNLFHVLNHAYMFGGYYCSEAASIIDSIMQHHK